MYKPVEANQGLMGRKARGTKTRFVPCPRGLISWLFSLFFCHCWLQECPQGPHRASIGKNHLLPCLHLAAKLARILRAAAIDAWLHAHAFFVAGTQARVRHRKHIPHVVYWRLLPKVSCLVEVSSFRLKRLRDIFGTFLVFWPRCLCPFLPRSSAPHMAGCWPASALQQSPRKVEGDTPVISTAQRTGDLVDDSMTVAKVRKNPIKVS